jgi:hypothetical protein
VERFGPEHFDTTGLLVQGTEDSEPVLYLATRRPATILHELYHARHSPVITTEELEKGQRLDEFLEDEFRADLYARRMRGKSEKLSMHDLRGAVRTAIDLGFSKGKVMSSLDRVLSKLGQPISREERIDLQSAMTIREKTRRVGYRK